MLQSFIVDFASQAQDGTPRVSWYPEKHNMGSVWNAPVACDESSKMTTVEVIIRLSSQGGQEQPTQITGDE